MMSTFDKFCLLISFVLLQLSVQVSSTTIKVTQLSTVELQTYVDEGHLLQPIWVPCAQQSKTSYLNFTFSPYPLIRKEMANISLRGFLDEPLNPGTKLTLTSRKTNFGILPGPQVSIDVCDVIAKQFPDAPYPVRCPLGSQATLLVLNNIRMRNSNQTAAGESSEATGISTSFKVPKFAATGTYMTTVRLEDANGNPITCSQTMLRIK